MVDLLNRRSYIRNLVRDVNEALEAEQLDGVEQLCLKQSSQY